MPKFSINKSKEVGEQFIQYLKDTGRINIHKKEELRDIYAEFKQSDDQLKPNFSNVLYALRKTGKAKVQKDTVHFGKVLKKTPVVLPDQYRAMRKDQGEEPISMPPPVGGKTCTKGQARRFIAWLKKNRNDFIRAKSGIDVVSDFDIGNGRIRFPLIPDEIKFFCIRVVNQSDKSMVFIQYKVLRRMRVFSFQDEQSVSKTTPLLLLPGTSYEICVLCSTDSHGYFPITMVFEFKSVEDESSPFIIGRFLSVVSNSKLAETLGPSSTYTPYQRNLPRPTMINVDEGVPPETSMDYELERQIRLHDYPTPRHLKDCIDAGLFSSKRGVTRFPVAFQQDKDLLSSDLHFENYDNRFHLLLHLEETQMEVDIRRYDIKNEKMQRDPRNKRLLVLNVPGVAENRPSVLKGDHLLVTVAAESGRFGVVAYKGYVHAVELEKVKLGFSQNLLKLFIDNMTFDVTFTFNRLPLKVQHRAVELAKENNLRDILFPTSNSGESIIPQDKRLSLYDRTLENNPEQYNAVKQIVSGISRPAPYLIFGPPGTGKTVTLVEAIKQVLKCIPNSNVLTCAPSNSASDLLCKRLMTHMDQRVIYRVMASSRDFRTVQEDIKPCCNWDKTKESYVYPSKEKLMKYRVIITTLVTAGRLVSANFPQGHFSHVFIDESGHAVEPECVTAIAGILDVMDLKTNKDGGQLVLAGDPKQLGPVLRSPVAIEHGLEISLLERLMTQNPLYQKNSGTYNSQFVTKLLMNYRSHPDILTIPNELFYDNELQVKADELVSHSYCNWEKLPSKGFPIIFHGVLGKDDREGNSPSFFNVNEIEQLMFYLSALLETQGKKGLAKISPKDIGIISPYRKQVEKLRKAIDIKLKNMADIKELKVGSVEEFQGQERKVILISTVRSSQDYVKIDEDFSLGFLKNPKRFNVAITRAKALLIVVGNPVILDKDPNWSRFLKYCTDKGGYKGYRYEEDMIDESDIVELLSSLNIDNPPPGEENGESVVQQQIEPSWRYEH
ncbi:hypothetical protein FKM82_019425 [Ascaphus truei]